MRIIYVFLFILDRLAPHIMPVNRVHLFNVAFDFSFECGKNF